MLTVNVKVVVKENYIEDFIEATILNASKSNLEEGIIRFDIIQELDNPQNFMLVEVYNSQDAPAAHKETDHYKTWRDKVEPMMAQPRSSIKYSSIFTKDTNYDL
ncbi:antibiotic biosynthesis monooxygenase [Thiospirochaeta perfilievii]|uniref:Antibiotic biosynthesis monooxygenase n=1 Tax=Thiospirochaeta perfilievii TaxID=252967 RepID=A0A5C1Q9C4_9SPIO|nr:putative quinol monooxygenase [Thiospirochaeta perfilievii]QEN04645.1 antibiotic biosynthesis monooxygenase [Thiospirochaeta perfilievii]